MTIYTDSQHTIRKLKNTPGYKTVVEIWKEDGRLIAALFTKER